MVEAEEEEILEEGDEEETIFKEKKEEAPIQERGQDKDSSLEDVDIIKHHKDMISPIPNAIIAKKLDICK